jgi:hypothetical protein
MESRSPVLHLGTFGPDDEARANLVADALDTRCKELVPQVGAKAILDGLLSLYVSLSLALAGEEDTRATLIGTTAGLPRLAAMLRAQQQDPTRA